MAVPHNNIAHRSQTCRNTAQKSFKCMDMNKKAVKYVYHVMKHLKTDRWQWEGYKKRTLQAADGR